MNLRRCALPLITCLLVAACQTVQYTGRRQMLLVSAGKENQMGEEAYRDILKKAKISTDREQVDLIRKVGRRLAKAANKPDFKWEFNLIDDDKQINAFCLPGGKVAFYTGILPVAKGEDGVAVVMSHEIAHALARHGGERVSQGQILSAGGQALGAILGGESAATQRLSSEAYAAAATLGVLLPYSRNQESEADHIGLILMVKSGYDPAQAVLFWKRMEQATEGKSPSGPLGKFMSTHPSSSDRQEKIKAALPEINRKYGQQKP
ncbi:MAG: M48 family metallopeptidase [Elusimicrobiota bacterium]